ncbi:MAG: hypothetical protein AAF515_20125 [Pseudomonadota bacterium]
MRILKVIAQVVGLIVLVYGVGMFTIYLDKRNEDGPSILFPGGELVSGDLHQGPDPDWGFTDDVFTIELQLDETGTSRRIFVMESDGKLYVPSGYMRSTLGRLWKNWAFVADEGDGLAVARIEGVRYARQLKRLTSGPAIDGVVAKMAEKYRQGDTSPEDLAQARKAVEVGEIWLFEMAPRA